MKYNEITDKQEAAASLLTVEVRVNAASAPEARRVIARGGGAKVVSCKFDGQYAILGIAITDHDAFWNPFDPYED